MLTTSLVETTGSRVSGSPTMATFTTPAAKAGGTISIDAAVARKKDRGKDNATSTIMAYLPLLRHSEDRLSSVSSVRGFRFRHGASGHGRGCGSFCRSRGREARALCATSREPEEAGNRVPVRAFHGIVVQAENAPLGRAKRAKRSGRRGKGASDDGRGVLAGKRGDQPLSATACACVSRDDMTTKAMRG